MNILEDFLKEKSKMLFGKENDILEKSYDWIESINGNFTGISRDVLLAQVYYLRTACKLKIEDSIKACEHFEKIPEDCFTEELIKNYIFVLKLSYQFEKAVFILKNVMNTQPWFGFEYFCLYEIADEAMVADGAITYVEYLEYKKQLKALLKKAAERLK